MSKANEKLMYQWVERREAVRIAKDAGLQPPWTNDRVIGKYRFCNVRREDDLVTRWVAKNIREPYEDHQYLWWMLCVARQINWPDTLTELMCDSKTWPRNSSAQGFSCRAMGEALLARHKRGDKVFTGAYNITAPPVKGMPKTTWVAEHTLGNLWDERSTIGGLWHDYGQKGGKHIAVQPSMKLVHSSLVKFDCWGPFLAYQAVVDMRFTSLLSEAKDVTYWAAAGPGTLRGLNRVAGRRLGAPLTQDKALAELRRWWPLLMNNTGVKMDFSDVPNVMCETDKYIRVLNGEGEPRATYVPGRGS